MKKLERKRKEKETGKKNWREKSGKINEGNRIENKVIRIKNEIKS